MAHNHEASHNNPAPSIRDHALLFFEVVYGSLEGEDMGDVKERLTRAFTIPTGVLDVAVVATYDDIRPLALELEGILTAGDRQGRQSERMADDTTSAELKALLGRAFMAGVNKGTQRH